MAAAAAELKQMQQQREQPPQLSNMVEAGPDLAAQLQVTVEPSAGYPGKQCRGAIQVVRWMPECAKDGRDGCIKPWKNKEHFLNYALLRPLLRAQEAALVAQAEGLDLERLNRDADGEASGDGGSARAQGGAHACHCGAPDPRRTGAQTSGAGRVARGAAGAQGGVVGAQGAQLAAYRYPELAGGALVFENTRPRWW